MTTVVAKCAVSFEYFKFETHNLLGSLWIVAHMNAHMFISLITTKDRRENDRSTRKTAAVHTPREKATEATQNYSHPIVCRAPLLHNHC